MNFMPSLFRFALVSVCGVLFGTRSAWAFPEMVQHGYVHCTACHTTLVGGQLLTPYGRALSRDLLSQKTLFGKSPAEGEEELLSGAIKTPEWLLAGGDIRLLQTFVESTRVSRARFMIMQVDLNFAAQATKRLMTFFSVGRTEPREEHPRAMDFVVFPRYGVDLLLSDPESASRWTARLGRFMPAYGINFAEHTLVTRRLLGFEPGAERLAGELAWADDQSSVILTAIGARHQGRETKSENGGVVQAATALGEKSKIGVNYYRSDREEASGSIRQETFGAFAHLALSKKWYALLELDRPDVNGVKGLVELAKIGYEIDQGLQVFGIQEFANQNLSQTDPKFEAYSIGAQWFPKPHWDLYSLYRRERDTMQSSLFQDVVWLIGHFYF
jgi:hypothetical protein